MIMAAALQDVHKANQVAINIGMGIYQRIANACLSSQMNDIFKFFLLEKITDFLA
jgi:hypothetical protein